MAQLPTKARNRSSPEQEIVVGPLETPQTAERRESIFRERLAVSATIMVGAVVILTLLTLGFTKNNAELVEHFADKILPQLLVAYSAIIGFYFGRRR